MAQATIDLNWSLPSISQAMGIDHMTTGIAQGNVWNVPGVAQDALDAAIAAYDDGGTKLAIAWTNVRRDRTKLLADSDWTQSPDTALGDSAKSSWATYRTALRDITTQADPYNITWPTAP